MAAPTGKLPRATVDTNQFVSALIRRGAPFQLLEAWSRGEFIVVSSAELAAEVDQVLHRPFLVEKYGVPERAVEGLTQRLTDLAEVVTTLTGLPEDLPLRDPNDRAILQTALSGRADYLVTGDDDLLSLNGHRALGSLRIVTVNEFLAQLHPAET